MDAKIALELLRKEKEAADQQLAKEKAQKEIEMQKEKQVSQVAVKGQLESSKEVQNAIKKEPRMAVLAQAGNDITKEG